MRDARLVLLSDGFFEHHLVLDRLLALALGALLERSHLVVLLPDDVLVAKRRLLGLVDDFALQLRHAVVELVLKLSQQRLLARARGLLQPLHDAFEPRLGLGAAGFLDGELLGERTSQLLGGVELRAHVSDLRHGVFGSLLTAQARDVGFHQLALRQVVASRVRHLARQTSDLRAQRVQPLRVRALLHGDAVTDLLHVVARANHQVLRHGFGARRLRATLARIRLRRLQPPAHLRREALRARVHLSQRVHAPLQSLTRAARADVVLLASRLGHRQTPLQVAHARRLRRRLRLRHSHALLQLARGSRIARAGTHPRGCPARTRALRPTRARAAIGNVNGREDVAPLGVLGGRARPAKHAARRRGARRLDQRRKRLSRGQIRETNILRFRP